MGERSGSPLLARRHVLAGATGLAIGGASDLAVAQARRPFDIDDFLLRQEVVAIVADPRGSAVALQISRPRTSGFYGSRAPAFVPRCDIWRAGGDLSGFNRITRGEDWFGLPVFSPNGRAIAMAQVGRDGVARLAVHRDNARHATLVDRDLRVDVGASLATSGERREPFAWLDDRSLLLIEKRGAYQSHAIALLGASRRRSEASDAATDGALSVRSWRTDDRATCSPSDRLVRIDTRTGRRDHLFEGDVRAASLSPDRQWVAIVFARRRLPALPDGRMPMPVGGVGSGQEDILVELGIAAVHLHSGETIASGEQFEATGRVSVNAGPLWADDSGSFAIPARRAYRAENEGDVAYRCEVASGRLAVAAFAARSPLDALHVAHLLAAEPSLRDATQRVAARPVASPETHLRTTTSFGGQVARVGGAVILAAGDHIAVTRSASAPGISISARVSGPLTRTSTGALACLAHTEEGPRRIVFSQTDHSIEPASPPPPRATTTVLLPATGQQLWVQDEDEESRITIEAEPPRVVHRFNRHFAQVRTPDRRLIAYRGRAGAEWTGVLYLPSARATFDRAPPVIVYAYPNSRPQLDSALGRPNSASSWLIQPFLAAGFAVFHAALPMELGEEPNAPFVLAWESIRPALDALDAIEDVSHDGYGFHGHSNGGFAALAVGAQSDRFKAITASAPFPDGSEVNFPVTNEIRMLSCAPNVVQMRRFYAEAPYMHLRYGHGIGTDAATLVANSPLYNLERYRTPTLMLYGEHDATLPAVEKMFLALQALGVPAELHTFWGEGHVLESPNNVRFASMRVVDWMRRHLMQA